MSGFEPIKVKYKDEEKFIPADNFLIILAEIEELITFDQLNEFLISAARNKGLKFGRLTSAYHRLLQLSGFKPPHQIALSKQVTSGEASEDAIGSLTTLFKQLTNDAQQDEPSEKKPKAQESS